MEKRKSLNEAEINEYKEWDEILEMSENDLQEKYLKVGLMILIFSKNKQMRKNKRIIWK